MLGQYTNGRFYCQPMVALFFIKWYIPTVESIQLKEWRERHSLTQDGLAELLKVAKNTVSRWERGDRAIPEYLELALEALEFRLSKNKTND